MDIFVCYSSEDRSFIDSLLSEAANKEIKFWASHANEIPSGIDYKEYIENKIDQSDGAVFFLSKSFAKSDFIFEVEIPTILNKQKIEGNRYVLSNVLIENFDYESIDFFKNKQLINSSSTSLDSLTSSQLSLVLRELIESFTKKNNERDNSISFSKKFLNVKTLVVFFALFGLFSIFSNQTENLDNEQQSEMQSVEVRGEEAFVGNLRLKMTEENVGKVSTLTDLDFVNHATWICSSLSSGIEGYFIYDSLWYLIAQDLLKYDISGEDVSVSDIGNSQYYIFNFANDYFCNSKTQVYDIENMYNFHSTIMHNNKRPEGEQWNFKTTFVTELFPSMYYERQNELLDTLSPTPSLVGYFYETNEMYQFFIENACSNILLLEDEEALDYIQGVFDNVQSLDDQNYQLDIFTIILEIVPQIFCEEYVDLGIRYSTYLYFIERKF